MSEYINIEILLWVCGAIGITWIIGYFVSVEQAKQSYDAGKADLDREILRAENKAFMNGYEKAKKEIAASKPPQTPKPAAKKVAPKPAAKKPVKKV